MSTNKKRSDLVRKAKYEYEKNDNSCLFHPIPSANATLKLSCFVCCIYLVYFSLSFQTVYYAFLFQCMQQILVLNCHRIVAPQYSSTQRCGKVQPFAKFYVFVRSYYYYVRTNILWAYLNLSLFVLFLNVS